MNPAVEAAFRSWPFDPWLMLGLAVAAAVYLRGWCGFRRRDPDRWPVGRPAAFLGGLLAIFLALASPIEPFAGLLLQVHMVQHLLLMMVAPPLLWLGHPLLPMVRGLPEPVRTYWVGPLFGVPFLRRLAATLTHPIAAWVLFVGSTWFWHAPPVYDHALRDPRWHYLQHVCFLGAGLLFWFSVVRPYPFRPAWPLWVLLPYLLLADVSNTVLSALLAFSDRAIYPHYLEVPRFDAGTALDDQSVAGVIMWVPGSVAYLVPMFAIGVRYLFGEETRGKPARSAGRISLPLTSASSGQSPPIAMGGLSGPFDLLRVPLLGTFLRWRYARPALQLPLLLLAVLVVWDGFTGPPAAPMNLAGVLPWVHWRGLLVFGLLVVGNVFCTACPFMLPRTIARRFLPAGRAWPRRLRSKWLAAALVGAFLVSYEAFSLWDRPGVTAWIVVGYFVAAFAVDGLFRGAAFCKYVCPIGQFNFVQSLASPLEVAIRDPAVCEQCETKDCIRGRDGIPGCELGLYLPRKSGNMDCTFCLDCVHACPHDNILIGKAEGGRRKAQTTGSRSKFQRPDVAALVLVLVFGAFVNAAGMTGPVLEWRDWIGAELDWSPLPMIVLSYCVALFVVPSVAVASAAATSRWGGQLSVGSVDLATRFAFSLVPLGFGMWLAHYGYHLLTSYDAAWPAFQRFAGDNGLTFLGEPDWVGACCRPVGAWLPRLEILFLDFGLLLSLHAAYRTAQGYRRGPWQTFRVLAPWAVLIVALFAVGVWIVLQPMDMRGTVAAMG
jgi:cytochrome c oxidase assembly factor CtaG/polyferredoxin